MKFQNFYKKIFGAFFSILFVLTAVGFAQLGKQQKNPAVTVNEPRTVVNQPDKKVAVALGSNVYCAGYVQKASVNTANKIVGALNEQDGHIFAQDDYLYISMGASKGVQVGDKFAVVRPRGRVETRWTKKNENLGFYVQEVGSVEVVRVKNDVSVVRVKMSCDNLLLGDLVEPWQARTAPEYYNRPALDIFGEPTGKASGRIFMARDKQELLGREQIVYIDLGAEDNVKAGDYLTVFRPLGKGNIFTKVMDESVSARDEGFQSDTYRGGKFSNQAARKTGEKANGKVETTAKAKEGRPFIRKVVGEIVILNVKEKTATALITRTAQEIHTGDYVELQ